MSRSTSLTFREMVNSQESGEVPIVLLTITHPAFATPLLLSSDPTTRISLTPLRYGTISRGNTYLFVPMSIALPDDIQEQAPVARFMMANVDRELIAMIRSISSPATADIEVLLASSPDSVEIAYPLFDIRGARYNASIITLEMSLDSLTEEPYPGLAFDPHAFPGLF